MNSEHNKNNPNKEAPQCLHKSLRIDDFVLLDKLGTGGMGEVWKAKQLSMKRDVALKILSPELSNDKEFVTRFLNEAMLTGRLQHPNIITAYTASSSGNYYYLATLFVDGIELQDKIRIDGMMPEREALNIVRVIASALCYAWEQHQLLHCDIKPGNIMIDRYRIPYLMDMGISKIYSENEPSPDGSIIVGSPQYMSPEQSLGNVKLDLRTDIYSLGVSLYEMLTAMLPFTDKIIANAIFNKEEKTFSPPTIRNPYLSEGCSDLITKMLSNDRNDRQSDWNYVLADIDAVLAGTYSSSKKIKAKKWDDIKSKKKANINAPISLGKQEQIENEPFLQTKKLEVDTKVEESHEPPPVIFNANKDRHSGLKLLILLIISALSVIGIIVYFLLQIS
ncbi:MAG: serine/threonine protein kinase [Victivallales bacterium]|nr:serine/threonine protein kinase [Victivallales bacterium]